MTNIVLARDPTAKRMFSVRKRSANAAAATKAAHRTPPGSSALRESEASAAKRPVGTEINPRFAKEPLIC